MSSQDSSGITITINGDSNDSNLVISSTSGSIVENGATGPPGPRGEAFQVDEFNVVLDDNTNAFNGLSSVSLNKLNELQSLQPNL